MLKRVSIPNRELMKFQLSAGEIQPKEAKYVSIPNRELMKFQLYYVRRKESETELFQSLIGS